MIRKLSFLLVMAVMAGILLSACSPDPATPDPAVVAMQTQLAEMAKQNDDLQKQLDEAKETEPPTLAPTDAPEPTPTPEPKRCGVFVAQGKIYEYRINDNGVIQRNANGKPLPRVLGTNKVEWFYKGVRTCVWKKWIQMDGGRFFKLWYNTKHLQTGAWLSHPEHCCYVKWGVFLPDNANYTLPH